MAWNFRPGIRIEIVFTLAVLIAGTIALIGILFLKVEERTLLQQKVRGGKQMIASLQQFLGDLNLADFVTSGERTPPENLQRIVTFFAQSHLFVYFSIVDRKYRILADSRPEKVGTILQDEGLEKALHDGKIFAHSVGESESFSLMKKSPLFCSAPLILRGETVGGLRGEIFIDDLRETHSRSQAMIFLYILFDAFLLITVGSFLLSRVIVNPLKKLVQMSEKIAKGNLDAMNEPTGGDEVGKLFSAFNRMASRLREDRAKMENYISSLEQVNRELRRAQNEVIRSEKLASIGRLASGVAHEVGNPTGAILGYLDLLANGGLTKEEEKEIFKRAGSEAERIRRIIRELLDFSRPSPALEQQVDINSVIANALSLLSHQKKIWEQIRVVKELGEDLPLWPGDPHQLQQVMINLFLNAIDALSTPAPQGTTGEKKLRVATCTLTKEEVVDFYENLSRRRKEDSPAVDYSLLRTKEKPLALSPGEVLSVVRVEVEDTGPGISPEALGKIFDPFYSTKPPGEGTGLGLAICLRIIEAYGGRIHVKSEEEKGTTFNILLPIWGEKNGTKKNINR
jgi:two-component system NtrC family sensor kinase